MVYSKSTNNTNVSLVTGGGRGLGKTIALRLAQNGPIILIGRTEADLQATCDQITAASGQAAYLVGDATDSTGLLTTGRTMGYDVFAARHDSGEDTVLGSSVPYAGGPKLSQADATAWFNKPSVIQAKLILLSLSY